MNKRERYIIASVLLIISLMTVTDLIIDSREGAIGFHIIIEGVIALVALFGVYWLIRGTFQLRQSLVLEKENSSKLNQEMQNWREQSKKYIEGLSSSIDNQLDNWHLTPSEKDVAFLLIKGFSSKEIAEFRQTSEKTVRAQSTSIYAKAGVDGRPQLAAFFLEDLLMPKSLD